jgi:hypothetical protein
MPGAIVYLVLRAACPRIKARLRPDRKILRTQGGNRMSASLAAKLHVARSATVAAYDQAIQSKAPQDLLDLLKAAIERLNMADKLRQQAKK